MTTADVISAAAVRIARAKRVVVFTGSGMSADSGIATFRGANNSVWGGIAGSLAMLYFGTPAGWTWTPRWTWKLYIKHFYGPIAQAQPNDGHRALAALRQILGHPVNIITQNVDGLHQRGGSPAEEVFEVHGTVQTHRCIREGHQAVQLASEELTGERVPTCVTPGCVSCLRPNAVLFGESLPGSVWAQADDATRTLQPGDVFIVVGTSGVVYPAAGLPEQAAHNGACIIECNVEGPIFATRPDDIFVPGSASKTLPDLVDGVCSIMGIPKLTIRSAS